VTLHTRPPTMSVSGVMEEHGQYTMPLPYIHTTGPSEDLGTPDEKYQVFLKPKSRPPSPSVKSVKSAKSVAEKEKEEEDTAEGQSDLLLDVAMTTAFASLLNGTPIMDGRSIASFLCIFVLVWWVWASHVAYNARFREFNWPHRVFLFFQLLVFCAFAAFTTSFDIGEGIVNDSATAALLKDLRFDQGWTNSTIAAKAFQENRLPILNDRGISMTMAFSRVLLLVQYLYAYAGTSKLTKKRPPFYVQNISLLFSIACYIAAFVVIGGNPSRTAQIVKIVLWFFPIILEITAHFLANHFADSKDTFSVKYDAKTFSSRSATIFIIILGAGLDNITQGFHFMVGNLSFGPHRIGVIFCASIIFILLFTLHFTTVPDRNRTDVRDETLKRRRDLALFFFTFFYLAAVIITLQGMASMMQVGNIGDSMQTAFQFLRESEAVMNSTAFSTQLTQDIYDGDTLHRLQTDGYDINAVLQYINDYIQNGTTPYEALLWMDMNILAGGLSVINALPQDTQSLVANEIYAFLDANLTDVNKDRFIDVAQLTITVNATPALWFSSSGGAILVILAAMTFIDRWNRMHTFAWLQVISRFTLGVLLIALVALDQHASTVFLDQSYQYQGSRIWRLATQSWILPPYALVLLLEQLWEYLLVYLARRTYDLRPM